MSYFPELVNMTDVSEVVTQLMTTTNQLYGTFVLIGIFVLGIIIQRRVDTDSIMVSGFMTIIISIFFNLIGLVHYTIVVQFIILGSVGFIVAVMSKR